MYLEMKSENVSEWTFTAQSWRSKRGNGSENTCTMYSMYLMYFVILRPLGIGAMYEMPFLVSNDALNFT